MDMEIQEYSLRFKDKFCDGQGSLSQLPKLHSCLLGDDAAPFRLWLQVSVNRLLYQDLPFLSYSAELKFRPPTAACSSSKVVLCAETATLTRSLDNLDLDDGEDAWELQFHGVSHVISVGHRSVENLLCTHELTALAEVTAEQ